MTSAKDGPMRRAVAAAWLVFISMAGTTMAFQVYHSVMTGHMPWELAVLYGTVPLLLCVCVLEFVSKWDRAPFWAKPGAYLIMSGAMYLSASATGAVVLHAAPSRMSWLFGILMDAAALLAVHFILNGPAASAASLAAALAETVRAELTAEADAARTALAAADAARTEVEQRAERAEADAASFAVARAELEDANAQLAEANTAREEAGREAAEAEAKTAVLTRKLAARPGVKSTRTAGTGTGRKVPGPTVPNDVDAHAEALAILAREPGITGAELGRRVGMGERWGQLRKGELAGRPAADAAEAAGEQAAAQDAG